MRIASTYILALIFVLGSAYCGSAASLDGHMQYRIVSYTLNSDALVDSEKPVNLPPLLITDSAADIFTDNFDDSPQLSPSESKSTTDVFSISADYLAAPGISLHGAFGITKNRWNASVNPEYEGSWEANLGVIYKLFNNIRYEVHFGYMDTGDLFKESDAYTDVESIIMISNKLSMSF